MIVACPTAMPATSVIALLGPVLPENGMPRARPRERGCDACAPATATARHATAATRIKIIWTSQLMLKFEGYQTRHQSRRLNSCPGATAKEPNMQTFRTIALVLLGVVLGAGVVVMRDTVR